VTTYYFKTSLEPAFGTSCALNVHYTVSSVDYSVQNCESELVTGIVYI